MLTYKELLRKLQDLPPEKLELNVTVFNADVDEYYPVKDIGENDLDDDVLDPGHPILIVGD